MLKIPNTVIEKNPGAIWATAIVGKDFSFINAQSVSFILSSGTGTAANVTLKIMAKKGSDGEATAVDFLCGDVGGTLKSVAASSGKKLSVGGTSPKSYIAVISADMLAGTGFDTVYFTTTAAEGSEVQGAAFAVSGNSRYSE